MEELADFWYFFDMPASKPSAPEVPRFALYGEQTLAELVHVELIETRSSRHDWHIDRHTHPGLFQVLFLLRGRVRASIEEALWERKGPVAITVHPSVVHGFEFAAGAQGYVLTENQNVLFSTPESQGDLFAPLFVNPLALPLPRAPRSRIEALLDNMLDEAAWPQQGNALMLEWLARGVLLLLARLHAERNAADTSGQGDFRLFAAFRAAVEQHYKSDAAVAFYAGLLRVTPVRLNRLCLRMAGKSAFEVIQDRLMLEACRKLTYAPSNVASIAYELGFQDPAYFSRTFKRHTGLTPRAFRARGNQQEAAPPDT